MMCGWIEFCEITCKVGLARLSEHEKLVLKLTQINKSALEEGVDPSDLDDIDEEYNFEETEKEAYYFYIGVLALIAVILLPYFYVFLKSVGAIGS